MSLFLDALPVGSVVVYLVIFAVTWMIYKLFFSHGSRRLDSRLPVAPGASWLSGHISEIMLKPHTQMVKSWVKATDSEYVVYKWMFGEKRLMISSPDAIKHVLVTNVKNYEKPHDITQSFLKVLGKNSLLNLMGTEHMAQRRICMGAFKPSFLRNLTPVFVEYGMKLVEYWNEQLLVNNTLEIAKDVSRCTMDIICQTGFDMDSNSLTDPDAMLPKAMSNFLGGQGLSWLFLIPYGKYIPTEANIRATESTNFIHKQVYDIIKKKKSSMYEQKRRGEEIECTDLLSMLMMAEDTETGAKLSDEAIHDHVITFQFAGHETTATALQWAFYMMAEHPEVQDKLYRIVDAKLPSDISNITEDSFDIQYLNCVVKEIMRIHPPVGMTTRVAQGDDVIDGYKVPKGTRIMLSIAATHRNAKYWTNPDEFLPERFETPPSSPYLWIPFIAGPRTCIGNKFALLEMKVLFALLIREFEFERIEGIKYKSKMRITVRPDPPLKLIVKRRSKSD